MPAEDGFWNQADTVSSVLAQIAVLAAAIAGMIKFRVLNTLGHRYKSELECRHHSMGADGVVFEADYTVTNHGQRPINLQTVTLSLCTALVEDSLLTPNRRDVLASRECKQTDPDKHGLFRIEGGERSIFTLRCVVPSLPPVVFVVCQLSWTHKREAAPFVGLYVAGTAPLRSRTSQPEPNALLGSFE